MYLFYHYIFIQVPTALKSITILFQILMIFKDLNHVMNLKLKQFTLVQYVRLGNHLWIQLCKSSLIQCSRVLDSHWIFIQFYVMGKNLTIFVTVDSNKANSRDYVPVQQIVLFIYNNSLDKTIFN